MPRSLKEQPARKPPSAIGSLLIVWLFFRLVLARGFDLVPDEAYYWTWSRHIAMGYLDHPPMVAWLIRLGTLVAGSNELGVRSASAFLATGTIWVVAALTRRLASPQAGLLAAVILVASPLMAILGVIATPDTPLCFFSICAVACAIRVFLPEAENPHSAWWIPCGTFWGLALLSKYTAVLVGLAILLALLSHPVGRGELKKIWAWAGAILGLMVFWPDIAWNAQHHWASFLFQLHHGSESEGPANPALNLLKYIGGQAGIWTPVLFAMGCLLLINMGRSWRRLTIVDSILFFSAAVPLIFFAMTSLRREPQVNWPCFAYLPMTILIARLAWNSRPSAFYSWTKIGIIVAACAMVMVQVPQIMLLIPPKYAPRVPGRWRDLYRWRELAQKVDSVRDDAPIYASSYETASELSFYCSGQPEVWNLFNDRPTAADFFPGEPDPWTQDEIVYVRNWPVASYEKTAPPLPEKLLGTFDCELDNLYTFALNRPIRAREIIVGVRWSLVATQPAATHPTAAAARGRQ
ncbi:MAG TPA: glycosyltransferase family 39 protein [Tepidisphaeraceae bacterium]|nr:glycosyltransferase family 39 protein [Tepidisphaeraceae bacterium]